MSCMSQIVFRERFYRLLKLAQAQFYRDVISHHVIIPLLSGAIVQQMHEETVFSPLIPDGLFCRYEND